MWRCLASARTRCRRPPAATCSSGTLARSLVSAGHTGAALSCSSRSRLRPLGAHLTGQRRLLSSSTRAATSKASAESVDGAELRAVPGSSHGRQHGESGSEGGGGDQQQQQRTEPVLDSEARRLLDRVTKAEVVASTGSRAPAEVFKEYSAIFSDALDAQVVAAEVFVSFMENSAPTTEQFNDMLRYCGDTGNKLLADRIAKYIIDGLPGVMAHPDLETFDIMFSIYSRHGDADKLAATLASMQDLELKPSPESFRYTFQNMLKAEEPNAAMAKTLADMMVDIKVPLDNNLIVALMNVFRKSLKPQVAQQVWITFNERGMLQPDPVNLTAVLNCYTHARNLDGALAVFESMTKAGVEPYYRTYDVLNELILNGDPMNTKVLKVIEKQIKSRLASEALVCDYLDAFGRDRMQKDSITLYKMWKKEGLPVTNALMNALCSSYATVGDSQFAPIRGIYMRNDLTPDEPAIRKLITMCAVDGTPDHATSLMLDLEDMKGQPTLQEFNNMVLAWSKQKDRKDYGKSIIQDIYDAGLRPNRTTFEYLLKCYENPEVVIQEIEWELDPENDLPMWQPEAAKWLRAQLPKKFPDLPAPEVIAQVSVAISNATTAEDLFAVMHKEPTYLTPDHFMAALERLDTLREEGVYAVPRMVVPKDKENEEKGLPGLVEVSQEQTEIAQFLGLFGTINVEYGRLTPDSDLWKVADIVERRLGVPFDTAPEFLKGFVTVYGTHYTKMTFHEKAHIMSYIEPYGDKFGKWFSYFAEDVVRPVEFYDQIPKEYGGRALWGACVALKVAERKDTEQCLQKIADHIKKISLHASQGVSSPSDPWQAAISNHELDQISRLFLEMGMNLDATPRPASLPQSYEEAVALSQSSLEALPEAVENSVAEAGVSAADKDSSSLVEPSGDEAMVPATTPVGHTAIQELSAEEAYDALLNIFKFSRKLEQNPHALNSSVVMATIQDAHTYFLHCHASHDLSPYEEDVRRLFLLPKALYDYHGRNWLGMRRKEAKHLMHASFLPTLMDAFFDFGLKFEEHRPFMDFFLKELGRKHRTITTSGSLERLISRLYAIGAPTTSRPFHLASLYVAGKTIERHLAHLEERFEQEEVRRRQAARANDEVRALSVVGDTPRIDAELSREYKMHTEETELGTLYDFRPEPLPGEKQPPRSKGERREAERLAAAGGPTPEQIYLDGSFFAALSGAEMHGLCAAFALSRMESSLGLAHEIGARVATLLATPSEADDVGRIVDTFVQLNYGSHIFAEAFASIPAFEPWRSEVFGIRPKYLISSSGDQGPSVEDSSGGGAPPPPPPPEQRQQQQPSPSQPPPLSSHGSPMDAAAAHRTYLQSPQAFSPPRRQQSASMRGFSSAPAMRQTEQSTSSPRGDFAKLVPIAGRFLDRSLAQESPDTDPEDLTSELAAKPQASPTTSRTSAPASSPVADPRDSGPSTATEDAPASVHASTPSQSEHSDGSPPVDHAAAEKSPSTPMSDTPASSTPVSSIPDTGTGAGQSTKPRSRFLSGDGLVKPLTSASKPKAKNITNFSPRPASASSNRTASQKSDSDTDRASRVADLQQPPAKRRRVEHQRQQPSAASSPSRPSPLAADHFSGAASPSGTVPQRLPHTPSSHTAGPSTRPVSGPSNAFQNTPSHSYPHANGSPFPRGPSYPQHTYSAPPHNRSPSLPRTHDVVSHSDLRSTVASTVLSLLDHRSTQLSGAELVEALSQVAHLCAQDRSVARDPRVSRLLERVQGDESRLSPRQLSSALKHLRLISGDEVAEGDEGVAARPPKASFEDAAAVDELFACSTDGCGAEFNSPRNLARHRGKCPPKELAGNSVSCTACSKSFASEADLRQHATAKHPSTSSAPGSASSPPVTQPPHVAYVPVMPYVFPPSFYPHSHSGTSTQPSLYPVPSPRLPSQPPRGPTLSESTTTPSRHLRRPVKREDFSHVSFPENSNVYVGGLRFDVTAAQLREAFEKFGRSSSSLDAGRDARHGSFVATATVTRDRQGKSKGWGFVRFHTLDAAKAAVSATHDGGRVLHSRVDVRYGPAYDGSSSTEYQLLDDTLDSLRALVRQTPHIQRSMSTVVPPGVLRHVLSHAVGAGVGATSPSSSSRSATDEVLRESAWTTPAAHGAAGRRSRTDALHFFTAASSSLSKLSDRQVASLMGCLAERIEEMSASASAAATGPVSASKRTGAAAAAADSVRELRLWFEVFLHSFLYVHHCRMAYQQDKLLVLQAIARADIPLNDRTLGFLRKADITVEVLEASDFLQSTPLESLAKVALLLSREEKWQYAQSLAERISRGVYDRITAGSRSIKLTNFCDATLALRLSHADMRRLISRQVALAPRASDALDHFSARDLKRFVSLCRRLGFLASDEESLSASLAAPVEDADGESLSEWLPRNLACRLAALPQGDRDRVLPLLPRRTVTAMREHHSLATDTPT